MRAACGVRHSQSLGRAAQELGSDHRDSNEQGGDLPEAVASLSPAERRHERSRSRERTSLRQDACRRRSGAGQAFTRERIAGKVAGARARQT